MIAGTADERHRYWMRKALLQAEIALEKGEVPVGAVLIKDDQLISKGFNLREQLNDPTAHAEIMALSAASDRIGDWRLTGCTLYVSLEPCPMCAGALVNARIDTVVYGLADPAMGACDSLYHLCEDPRLNHRVKVISGILAPEIRQLMDLFFMRIRQENRA
ncbi:MAG TPA: nucleoside deaminase [Candidatus Marinimicrobia bacterium]|nr:nucleoside deaminase [Candidatus Neomarinimicrobiota bacterium]